MRRSSSPLGDRQRANDSLPHADPFDGPSVGLPSTYAGTQHLPKSVLFRRSIVAIPPRNNRLGATHSVSVRGGATPPAVENVDRSLVDVCPLRGRRSPLAAIRSWRTDLRDCMESAGARGNVSPCCATVTALAPTRDRAGVLGRVKVPRAPRAAASTPAATLTPPPRARRRATIGASRNHERGHHRMPVVLLADRGIERPGVRVEDQTRGPDRDGGRAPIVHGRDADDVGHGALAQVRNPNAVRSHPVP